MRALLYRRFAVFHAAFPVDGAVANLGKTTRAAVDAEVNVGKMLVVCNFRTLLDTNIARISLDSCVSLYRGLIIPEPGSNWRTYAEHFLQTI